MTLLSKWAYKKMIIEDIQALEKHMPKHSLEKIHAIAVLKDSINRIYKKQ